MKKFTIALFLIVSVVTFLVGPVSGASAAKPISGGSGSTPVGNDISWPQCGKRLPSGQAFGIVGVNGGLATTTNKCLSDQLLWAKKSVGGTKQPLTQLYVNTANPGEIIALVTTWPTNNLDKTGVTAPNPYGLCDGKNNLACSWQYGWNRAVEDVIDRFVPAAQKAGVGTSPSLYTWWLDVETENTWQSGSPEALALNAATLEAMTAYFQSLGAKVGLYSTNYQWGIIAGSNVGLSGKLTGLDSWLAGASSLQGAKSNCAKPALTGGIVTLTQYVSGALDYDYSCIN